MTGFSGFSCSQQLPSPIDDTIVKPVLAPTGAAQPISPSSYSPIQLEPVVAKQHIARIDRFRILVMGRANAGKTTILQRLCNTMDQTEIFNGRGQKVDTTMVHGSCMRGHHNIEDELVFASNPGFVFHDSCGFEAGSEEQFNMMKNFVMDRARTTKLDKRIHAIWYCIPLNERHRMVLAAEEKFFDYCDTGHVPVIVLLTKADTVSLDAWQEIEEVMEDGLSVDDTKQVVAETQGRLLENSLLVVKGRLEEKRFCPHDYLIPIGMQQEGAECTSLLTCTANALTEEGLQQLLISTQQSNLELCMEFAIRRSLKYCMKEQGVQMGPNVVASMIAAWFPYKARAFEGETAAREAFRFRFAFAGGFAGEAAEAVDHQLVPVIQQSLASLRMPELSTSMQYSMQYIAEQGIGVILVLEYLYFLLQVSEGPNDLQVYLDLAVEQYETSGTRESVGKLVKEAFHEHGENVEILCPIFVQVAKGNQMSRHPGGRG